MSFTEVKLYTDGASKCNGSPDAVGGWSAILLCGNHKKVISGGEKGVTNNMMELRAVIEGVKALKKPCEVAVYTDSTYVINGATNMREWISRGWKTAGNKPVANKTLWQELIDVGNAGKHHLTFHHVEGHAGNELNEECDKLAKKEAAYAQNN